MQKNYHFVNNLHAIKNLQDKIKDHDKMLALRSFPQLPFCMVLTLYIFYGNQLKIIIKFAPLNSWITIMIKLLLIRTYYTTEKLLTQVRNQFYQSFKSFVNILHYLEYFSINNL